MALGMTYEQYWYGDVRMTAAFRKADEIRKEQADRDMWAQGMYIYDAISRLFPIPIAFAGKNAKQQPYVEKPYQYKEKKEEVDKELISKKKAQARGLQAMLFSQP